MILYIYITMVNDDPHYKNKTHLAKRVWTHRTKFEFLRYPEPSERFSEYPTQALEQGIDKGCYSRPLRQHHQ